MSFMNTIHGGGAPSLTTSVYYTGSDTLLEGYALCYDFNAADVNQENATQTSPNVGEEVWADARRVLVEKCQEGNKIHFAGVVAAASDNTTGPGWVTIHRPGSVCNVYAASDCDHETSAGTASGQLLQVTVNSYAMTDVEGFGGTGAAIVLQDVDRSSTNGLIMAELQTGPPSGGYCLCTPGALISSASGFSISAIVSAVPAYCGVYQFDDGSAATNGNIISADMLSTDGSWGGQKVLFRGSSTLISNAVSIEVHAGMKGMSSTITNTCGTVAINISANGEYFAFEYDQGYWRAIGGHENFAS
jgi:hypothetical protein